VVLLLYSMQVGQTKHGARNKHQHAFYTRIEVVANCISANYKLDVLEFKKVWSTYQEQFIEYGCKAVLTLYSMPAC